MRSKCINDAVLLQCDRPRKLGGMTNPCSSSLEIGKCLEGWCEIGRRCVPRLRCLVVLPTRDLASQVFKVCQCAADLSCCCRQSRNMRVHRHSSVVFTTARPYQYLDVHLRVAFGKKRSTHGDQEDCAEWQSSWLLLVVDWRYLGVRLCDMAGHEWLRDVSASWQCRCLQICARSWGCGLAWLPLRHLWALRPPHSSLMLPTTANPFMVTPVSHPAYLSCATHVSQVTVQAHRLILSAGIGLTSNDGVVDILVATPGRLMAHLKGTPGATLDDLRYLVCLS